MKTIKDIKKEILDNLDNKYGLKHDYVFLNLNNRDIKTRELLGDISTSIDTVIEEIKKGLPEINPPPYDADQYMEGIYDGMASYKREIKQLLNK